VVRRVPIDVRLDDVLDAAADSPAAIDKAGPPARAGATCAAIHDSA